MFKVTTPAFGKATKPKSHKKASSSVHIERLRQQLKTSAQKNKSKHNTESHIAAIERERVSPAQHKRVKPLGKDTQAAMTQAKAEEQENGKSGKNIKNSRPQSVTQAFFT